MPKLPVNRLVIVEDNQALSDTLSEFVRLEPRLSLVEVFSSVTDTLAWLREMSAKVTIDLLLLDLHLPDQDGWSILDDWILRGRTPRTLIYRRQKGVTKAKR